MGYNVAKKSMKKLLLMLVAIFGISFTVNAQTSSGSCKLPGTYDYVNVDYYSDGHIVVSNQSGMVITQLHITVKIQETWEANGKQKHREQTLCDQNYYDIQPYQSTRIEDGVKELGRRGDYMLKYNNSIEVTVSNPICK